MTRLPCRRVTSARRVHTELAAHSGQGDFISRTEPSYPLKRVRFIARSHRNRAYFNFGFLTLKRAMVAPPTVHGLRHTCATLLLAAGVPPHVVQRRLGHKKIEMTLNLYAHVLPSMQADAASRLATLLHG